MTFDIHQLDNLDYDDVGDLLDDYIDGAISQFDASSEGQAYAAAYPDTGGWISVFIELGYNYEGLSLPEMSVGTVESMMQSLLPRKITVGEAAEAEEAIPELAAFWGFLGREYQLPAAAEIRAYLLSIEGKFGEWMVDPARGGMAKSFLMGGMAAGFDMGSEEGLRAYQQAYNAQQLKSQGKGLLPQKIANLFGATLPSAFPSDERPPVQSQKPAKQKPEVESKGFGAVVKPKASRRKKKKKKK